MDVGVLEHRIGGAGDLPRRVAEALSRCYEDTGGPPTARRYQQWRNDLTVEDRDRYPSLTAVVPIAYPTWHDARTAAGIPSSSGSSHGPTPKWSEAECVAIVGEWLAQTGGRRSLAMFTAWVDEQRRSGRDVPSVSTIRLRLRRPWSGIVAVAGERG